MVSDLHRHFRVVASGVKAMGHLISSGSSPLNNLRQTYLGVLPPAASRRLVAAGFDGPDDEVVSELERQTGGHPYLLQGLLETLWNLRSEGATLDASSVRSAAREFLQEHADFRRWMDTFGPAEHATYCALAAMDDGAASVEAIRVKVQPELRAQVDDALTVLSYHGVIDDSDPDEPRLAGVMFRDWYLRRYGAGEPSSPRLRRAVFVSYSHRDPEHLERLQIHLALLVREGHIHVWDDTRLKAGERWRNEIQSALASAKVGILLISADFLSSDFITEVELPRLLSAAARDGCTIIPVIVGPSSYDSHAQLREFQAINSPDKPLSRLRRSEREQVWVEVARRVRSALEDG